MKRLAGAETQAPVGSLKGDRTGIGVRQVDLHRPVGGDALHLPEGSRDENSSVRTLRVDPQGRPRYLHCAVAGFGVHGPAAVLRLHMPVPGAELELGRKAPDGNRAVARLRADHARLRKMQFEVATLARLATTGGPADRDFDLAVRTRLEGEKGGGGALFRGRPDFPFHEDRGGIGAGDLDAAVFADDPDPPAREPSSLVPHFPTETRGILLQERETGGTGGDDQQAESKMPKVHGSAS